MEATKTFNEMNKEELRAACRAAGISYSKLNNDGMRAALQALEAPAAAAAAAAAATEEAAAEETGGTDAGASVFAMMVNPVAAPVAPPSTVVRDGKKVDPNAPAEEEEDEKPQGYNHTGVHKCPDCGAEHDQTWANEGVSLFCHLCSCTYSATTGRKIRAGYTRDNVNKGYKIQKDRIEQNGVKRPSAGTLCGNVWAALDALREQTGMPIAADLPAMAEANGWNKNNVMCEFYQWRKFNGIAGRQSRGEAPVKDAGSK